MLKSLSRLFSPSTADIATASLRINHAILLCIFTRQQFFVFPWNFAREIGARPAHARRLTAVFSHVVLPRLGAY